ncbi:hypothetical protein J4208_05270 [Candidatus Woesearchaeota archaeon]|nr:hypothetical protein [Candidatus Woesearchaeota archaeon]
MKNLFLLMMSLLLLSATVLAEEQGLIRVDLIGQDPDPVRAGDVVEVRFKIENWWEDTKEDVSIEIIPSYPFTIYGESNIKSLGRLEGRKLSADAVFADFKLRVDPRAVDGEQELLINIYTGTAKIEYKDLFFIDIENEQVKLRPYIASSDIVVGGNKGSITLDIANSGGYNVNSLELELLPSDNYRLLSTSNYVYIGDVDADDVESEDFDIYVNRDLEQVKIPIRLTYEADDTIYTDEHTLTLDLLSTSEAKQLGLVQSNTGMWITIVIVLVIVGYIVYRKRFRKR